MLRFSFVLLTLLLVAGTLTMGLAASPAIGIATARGSFHVDHARVSGNTTLFDGTLVETGTVGSLLQLDGGVRMRLGSASRGKVYRERLVLERGEGQLDKAGAYQIEVASLRVVPASSDASARVALNERNRVQVSALNGDVQVTTGEGVLVASVEPGRMLEFEPQAAGAAAPFSVTGCLQSANARYLLKDGTTNVTFELQGSGLEKEVGNQVEIAGTQVSGVKPGDGADNVIRVYRIKRLSGRCVSAPAKRSSSKTTGKAAGSAGMSGTTKAVIAGVAIAAAGAGTTLALVGEEEKATVSR